MVKVKKMIMKYKKHYKKLISTRRDLGRIKNKEKHGEFENHHILPKCFGGTNGSNLILLTPKEHYVAHLLLTEMYEGKDKAKMCYALLKMCDNNPNQRRKQSSRRYEYAKKLVSENCSGENHHMYRKKLWSDEQKKEISERMKGKGNPMYGRKPWNYGLTGSTHSEESKKMISQKNSGIVKTKEWREKLSKAHKGKKLSEETKQKLREINLGKKLSPETIEKTASKLRGKKHEIVECPICGKKGGKSSMKAWHFDKCKWG